MLFNCQFVAIYTLSIIHWNLDILHPLKNVIINKYIPIILVTVTTKEEEPEQIQEETITDIIEPLEIGKSKPMFFFGYEIYH